MSYCIAFSVDGAADVTHRYVRTSDHALARRRCSEDALRDIIDEIKNLRRTSLSGDDQLRLDCEDFREEEELRLYMNTGVPHQDKETGKTSKDYSAIKQPKEMERKERIGEHLIWELAAASSEC